MDPLYTQLFHKYSMQYRRFIDKYIMYKNGRWMVSVALLLIYLYRITQTQSYFVVSYMFGIYTVQLLLKYLTPLGLPDVEDEEDDMDVQLPQHSDDRPLLRSMAEIHVWESWTFAIIFAIFATCFQIFDLPVYWPFLLSYFIMIMVMTFKRYLKHMRKYGYSLADFGKR